MRLPRTDLAAAGKGKRRSEGKGVVDCKAKGRRYEDRLREVTRPKREKRKKREKERKRCEREMRENAENTQRSRGGQET